MIDIVLPEQNEEDFIRIAERLGYDSLCFFYKEMKPAYKIHIETLQKKTKIRLYTASSDSGKTKPDIIVVRTTDARPLLERRNVDLVYGVESNTDRDSINSRKSGLNHILCTLAKQNKKMIGFDFSSIVYSNGARKASIMGRFMQNIRLCRKFKPETAIASFARSPLQMRNPYDIRAFFSLLGMDEGDIKRSLSSVEERIAKNKGPER